MDFLLGLERPECEEVGEGVADANAAAAAVDDNSMLESCECPRADGSGGGRGENKSGWLPSPKLSCRSCRVGIWRDDRLDDGSREWDSATVAELGAVLDVNVDMPETETEDCDCSSSRRGGSGGGNETELPFMLLPSWDDVDPGACTRTWSSKNCAARTPGGCRAGDPA